MLYFNQIYNENGKNLKSFKNFLIQENVGAVCDNFILVKSSPSQYPSFELNEILNELNINAINQFVIGHNCTTILNALTLSQALNMPNDSLTIIYICDSFSDYISNDLIDFKPSISSWKDYSSGIVFRNYGKFQFEIISYYSRSVNSLFSIAHFEAIENGWKLSFNENSLKEFRKTDLGNELYVINKTLERANIKLNELSAIVTTNREIQRTELLKGKLQTRTNILHSSRNEIGHTGGSDILFNLNKVLKSRTEDELIVLISANGLGYTWSSMVVKIKIK